MILIRDTREQKGHGWIFGKADGFTCTKVQTMKSGDYTLEGYEDVLAIERKGSVLEFAQNVTQKRFENELDRLAFIPHTFVILEFDMYELINFPSSSKLGWNIRKNIKITGAFIHKRLNELQLKYPTKFMFAGPYGQEMAISIMKRITEKYERNKSKISI